MDLTVLDRYIMRDREDTGKTVLNIMDIVAIYNKLIIIIIIIIIIIALMNQTMFLKFMLFNQTCFG